MPHVLRPAPGRGTFVRKENFGKAIECAAQFAGVGSVAISTT